MLKTTSMSSNEEPRAKDENVCRDYLRNSCVRGDRCRFQHVSRDQKREVTAKDLQFCHDFQNTGCPRRSCKFVHCSVEEEMNYVEKGILPQHVIHSFIQRGVIPDAVVTEPGEVPICKDFLKNECFRGLKCRFRHTYLETQERKIEASTEVRHAEPENDTRPKRLRQEGESVFEACVTHVDSNVTFFSEYTSEIKNLREENVTLKQQLEGMKRQLYNLMATNEFLLEQNAHLRLGKMSSVVSGLYHPISQLSSAGGNLGVITQPAQSVSVISQNGHGQPTVSMSGVPTVQTLATVSVPTMTVPVTVPVSCTTGLATVSIAHIPDTISTSYATLTDAGSLAPRIQIPSAPITLNTGATSLGISSVPCTLAYPIMSQATYPVVSQATYPVVSQATSSTLSLLR